MTGKVMFPYFGKVAGFLDSWELIYISGPSPQIGILVYVLLAAFEVSVVYMIKSHQSRKEANV